MVEVSRDLLAKESFSDIFNYQLKEAIRREVYPVISKKLLEDHQDEIIKKVLLDVNWSEVIRSEVAQRVIKEISR